MIAAVDGERTDDGFDVFCCQQIDLCSKAKGVMRVSWCVVGFVGVNERERGIVTVLRHARGGGKFL